MTTMEMAALLGVNTTTVSKVAMRHLRETGTNAPGHHGMNNYTEEYAAWFNSRPDGRSFRRGPRKESMPLYPAPEPSRVLVTEPPEVDTPVKPTLNKEPQSAHVQAQITGLTPASRQPDVDALWKREIDRSRNDQEKTDVRYTQEIVIPDPLPCLFGNISDGHLGNVHCDVALLKHHADLFARTPGAYVGLYGDMNDNWIGKPEIMAVQRQQRMSHAEELALWRSYLQIIKDKLLVVVSGNHENRTEAVSGIDLYLQELRDVRVLYDADEVRFLLRHGDASWRFKARHKWRRSSMYNDTHGMEADAKFQDGSWDVAIGGHRHGATVVREFFDHAYDRKVKLAIQLGAYEVDSAYGRRLNLARSVPGGCAALMIWPTGEMQPWHDVDKAVEYLAYVRGHA